MLMVNQEITNRKNTFFKDLSSTRNDMEWLIHKHLIRTPAYIFLDNQDKEQKLAEILKNYFNINYKDFIIVGSAQLGFSLNPQKNYRDFNESSDIDIAIINQNLFIELKQELYNFTDGLNNCWKGTHFHSNPREYTFLDNNSTPPKKYVIHENQFKYYKYLSQGWFRADFKPNEFEICRNNKKFSDFNKEIKKVFSRKIGLAIYENWFFFLDYHSRNLTKLKLKTEVEPNVAN